MLACEGGCVASTCSPAWRCCRTTQASASLLSSSLSYFCPPPPYLLPLTLCATPPTAAGYEDDTSGRKRYGRDFLFYYGNKCTGALPQLQL